MRIDPRLRIAAIGGGLLLTFLVANAFVSESNLRDIISASNQAGHTRAVLASLNDTLSSLQDAETIQSTYLLTWEQQYLAPYRAAARDLESRLAALESLATTNAQRAEMGHVKREAILHLQHVNDIIRLHDTGRVRDALDLARQEASQPRTASIRKAIASLAAQQQAVLDARETALQSSLERSRATTLIATSLGVGLLGIVFIAFMRQMRHSAELELQKLQSEQRFRQLADSIPVMMWSESAEGKIAFCNRFFYKYTGAKPEEDLDQAMCNSIHEEDLPRLEQAWRAARTSSTELLVEVRYRHRGGEYRWFETRCAPVKNRKGAIEGWFGSAVDVHDEKLEQERLASAVAQRTTELSEANRELQGFTYSVSHDLRAPLRAIASTSHILLEDYGEKLPESGKDLLLRQAAAATKLGQLIDDLLHLARLSRMQMRRDALDLSTMGREIAAQLTEGPDADNHEYRIAPSLRATGDPQMVRLALENLLANAKKFSPNGGVIELGESEPGAFYVRDEGVGFDMAYSHKLFEPFERLVTESEFPGTGIGLSNVRRAVERHGGQVWARSEPGKGATFFFTLGPVHDSMSEAV